MVLNVDYLTGVHFAVCSLAVQTGVGCSQYWEHYGCGVVVAQVVFVHPYWGHWLYLAVLDGYWERLTCLNFADWLVVLHQTQYYIAFYNLTLLLPCRVRNLAIIVAHIPKILLQ